MSAVYLSVFNIQKKVSSAVIVSGICSLILNIIYAISENYSFIEIILNPSIYVIFSSIIFIGIFYNRNNVIVRFIHVLIFFLSGIISIFEEYDSFYGIGLIIIGVMLMYKYNFFNKYALIKILTMIILLIVTIEISYRINNLDKEGQSAMVLFFLIFFILLIYLIFTDELNSIFFKEKLLNKSIEDLESEKKESEHNINILKRKILLLEIRIDEIHEKELDVNDYKLTRKELHTLRVLCKTNGSNKEIAKKLKVETGTVKQHLTNIYSKTEAKSRIKLIEMFRKNFM
ncbi:MAG: LuxR C-terminal-related transcriptional regulator [Spirochaetaceae bacterium]